MAYEVFILADVIEQADNYSVAVAEALSQTLNNQGYYAAWAKSETAMPYDFTAGKNKPYSADSIKKKISEAFGEITPDLIITIKWNSKLITLNREAAIYLQHNSSIEQQIAKNIKNAFPMTIRVGISKGDVFSYDKNVPMLKFAPLNYLVAEGQIHRDANYIAKGIINYFESAGIKPTEQQVAEENQNRANEIANEIQSSEPSYSLMDYNVSVTDYDIPSAASPSIQASIDAAAGTVTQRIYEKQITLHSDYLIYFDDVLMNEYVLSYNANLGVDIGIGNASVAMMYAPSFNKISVNDSVSDGIENGIQLKIFESNVFSGKYNMVFDGIIKQKMLSRDSSGFQLTFSAVDYLYWMNKIIAPISIPFNEAVSPGERLKWKAQSVDPDKTANVEISKAGSLKGKTIQEYFDRLKEKSFSNSKIYSEENSVVHFDDTVNRVEIMGDINKALVRDEVIDFVVNSNSVFADTVYVSMSNTTNNLMMEFYQDRDGIIRIKPPFWNEAVLKDHIIDPLMIISSSETTDWTKYYTRIIVTGGVEEWMPESGSTSTKVDLLTPVGVYLGSLTDKSQAKWADYTSEGERGSSYREVSVTVGGQTSGSADGNSLMSSNPSVNEFLNATSTGSFPAQEWGDGSGTQCVEFPKYYIEAVWKISTKHVPLGNGMDMWHTIPEKWPEAFSQISYSSPASIQSGDIISLTSPSKPAYGHAAVVKSVSGNSIVILEQWQDSGTVRVTPGTISGKTINFSSQSRTIYGMARHK